MSATPLRAGAGMCRVPLPYHASAPHRFSLATLPVRSGVRNDGEKITIRVAEPDDLGAPRMTTTPDRDRKSTRLNSSHVSISYAVFCLKKKKKKTNHDTTTR